MQISARSNLTQREHEVLHLVAQGKRNKDIAEVLRIECYTVEVHLKNIFRKLQVRTRTEAAQSYWKRIDVPVNR
jgi:DNA-binding NarL/FixJ family response regulator